MFFNDLARVVEAALPMNTSHDALRQQLHAALKTAHGIPADSWSMDSPWIHSGGVFPGHVVYNHKGGTFKRSYTATHGAAGTDPTIKLGEPKAVHTAYVDSKTTESLSVFLNPLDEKKPTVIITEGEEGEAVRESVAFDESVKVTESKMTTIPVKVIKAGWGSMAYYPKEVLKRDGPKVFTKGTHMYWNHQTATEEAERPEGDLNDLAAVLTKDAEWQEHGIKGPGLYSEAKVFSDYATQVSEKGSHIGVSINAGIKAHIGEAEGRTGRIADAFTRAFSTDFVTKAGAGGAPIVPVTESRRAPQGETSMTAEEQAANAALIKENADLKKESADLQTRLRAIEASQHEVVAYATVATVLKEADIPFKESLLKRACTNPVMKEGKPDADWVKSIVADFSEGHTGRVTDMGDDTRESRRSERSPSSDQDKRMKEAMKGLGVPDAGLAYATSGRS